MRRAAVYLRVSTQDQTTANQERELRAVAERMGCEIVRVFRDHGVSGAEGRDKRLQFDAMCKDAARRQFDVVMAWSVDRLGRSVQDLVASLSDIHALKIDLYLHQQGIDTTTPAGKAMFQMMGVFAEFERAMIQERVRAGIKRYRAEGNAWGRPAADICGRPSLGTASRASPSVTSNRNPAPGYQTAGYEHFRRQELRCRQLRSDDAQIVRRRLARPCDQQ